MTMATNRQYLLEQIDDAAVVQLYADGFGVLPLDQTILVSVAADRCSVEWRRQLAEFIKA